MRKKKTPRLGRPPATDSAETRQRVLREARSCFSAFGYEATSNRMIAERAGLTTAAIYHYFGSKKDLFLAVHNETQEPIYARMKAAMDTQSTLLDKLWALLDVSLEVFQEDPESAAFIAIDPIEIRRHKELQSGAERRWQDLYRELIEFGVSTGEIRREDAAAARGVLAAMILGLSQLASGVSVEAHRENIRGFRQLLGGDLLQAPVASTRRRRVQ